MPRFNSSPETLKRMQAAEARGKQMTAELVVALRALNVGATHLADEHRKALREAVHEIAKIRSVAIPVLDEDDHGTPMTERALASQYYQLATLLGSLDAEGKCTRALRRVNLAVYQVDASEAARPGAGLDGFDPLDGVEGMLAEAESFDDADIPF